MSTVIIQEPEKIGSSAESPQSLTDQAAAQAIEQAAAFGAMTESFRQSQAKQMEMEAELRAERERREIVERRLDTISGQTDQILTALQKAAAQEPENVTSIIPPLEMPQETEPPARKPGLMERIGNRLNGL